MTGQTYICDLGIAKLQDLVATLHTSKGQGAGTPLYKAPEMFVLSKRSTPADIYSYGCVLIELFGGKRVWENVELLELFAKLCGSPPQTPPTAHIPLAYRNICTRCTAHAASERPTAAEVIKTLKELTCYNFCDAECPTAAEVIKTLKEL